MAKWLIVLGALLLLLGALLHLFPGLFGWFGKLPGDLDIETGHSRLFIPITSMIIISAILTLVLNLFNR